MGKSVAYQSFWSVTTQLGVHLGGAFSSVILNRALKPEGRGEVALVTFWPTILGYLLVAGWIPAIVAHVSRKPEDSRGLWLAWVSIGVALALPVILVGWFLVPSYLPGNPDLWWPSRWFLFYILFVVLGTTAQGVLEANGHFDLAARARLSQMVVSLPVLLLLALTDLLVPTTYLMLLFGITALMNAYSIWLMVRTSRGAWSPHFYDTPHYFLRAAPFDCVLIFQLRVDQTLILTLMPPNAEALGIYVAGFALGGMLAPIASGLAPVLFTQSAKQGEPEALRLLLGMGRAFILFCLLFGIPAALASEWILRLAFGPAFQQAAPAMRVSLLNAMLGGLFLMLINTLRGMHRPGTATLIGLVICLVSMAGAFLLLPRIGYIGAAFGQTIGYVTGLGFLWFVLRKRGLSVTELVPQRADFTRGVALAKRGLAYLHRTRGGNPS